MTPASWQPPAPPNRPETWRLGQSQSPSRLGAERQAAVERARRSLGPSQAPLRKQRPILTYWCSLLIFTTWSSWHRLHGVQTIRVISTFLLRSLRIGS
ncbi:uncharacterized protein LY79DRAFT_548079 [Colletotrichum navitas]|uniref:Uncharacterized protein n=1 Tax=Colletotrichum navitas TaxID=681940 RepID=A0AAD8Q373_9PEZI|nr:uncharacterized protein LY79DRAFT_548079 [Colletotrichum navitas]KAK1595096.1 hypothetical protein LY79DRAFT_548079 [Colletotrichum navitas]